MSDPRVEAAFSMFQALGTTTVRYAEIPAVLVAADAADPLLRKVRALYEAVRDVWAAYGTGDNYEVQQAVMALLEAASIPFSHDDLARLGVTERVTP